MGPSLHYILDSFRARGQLQLHVCEQVSGHLVRLSDQSKPHISFVFDLKDHIHKEKGKRVSPRI